MSYIRKKIIKGNEYHYEQESYREGNQVKTRHLRYIGSVGNVGSTSQELGTTQENIYETRAIKEFGLTENENEAGYINANGKMLDFSGRSHATGYKNNKPLPNQPDYLKNSRGEDHRQISNIFSDKERKEGYDNIKLYGEKTGSIRLTKSSNDNDINIELFKKPSPQQLSRIKSIQTKNKGKIYADLTYKKDFKGNERSVYGGESKVYNNYSEFEKDL